MALLRLLVVMTIATLTMASNALAEKRVALVIGNSNYTQAPALANPKNDAEAMAAKLKGLGFEVVLGLDLTIAGLRTTIRRFTGKLEGADTALFYYAGHGLQVNGENYIAPIDASLKTENDLDFEALPINFILRAMERNTETNLVFLDACRDNPLARNLARSMGTRSAFVGRGLAQMGTGVGTFISYSTEPGNVALDGSGKNSPYTGALLKHLGNPGENLTVSMVKVRREVIQETNGKQVPWERSSLTGGVILQEAAVSANAEAAPKPAVIDTKPVATASSPHDLQIELTFWNSIKDSGDPALFNAYLSEYPKGKFSAIARYKAGRATRQNRPVDKVVVEVSPSSEQEPVETVEQEATETAMLVNPDESPVESPDEGVVVDEPITREGIRNIQRELNRVGCSAGKADGIWGRKSKAAVSLFNRHSSVDTASLEPSDAMLNMLRGVQDRVCPLVCGRGFEVSNGICKRVKNTASVTPPASKTQKRTKSTSQRTQTRTSTASAPKAKSQSTDLKKVYKCNVIRDSGQSEAAIRNQLRRHGCN